MKAVAATWVVLAALMGSASAQAQRLPSAWDSIEPQVTACSLSASRFAATETPQAGPRRPAALALYARLFGA